VILAAFIAVCAVLLDWLLGEPQRMHPLVGFGRVAQRIDALFNCDATYRELQRLGGALALVLLVAPPVLACMFAAGIPTFGFACETLLLYLVLGGQSLREHAHAVKLALHSNDLPLARTRVGFMVSRDTTAMTTQDVARATIESVLENGNDAVFGALFWFAVAGAPGAVLYRLVNTLDAMWGYRTARYFYFGWAAARLDDVLNFIPARLTALTYAMLGRFTGAWHCWRTQGRLWESPNAGPVMAAGAGALGIQLGGPAFYHGAWKERPALGTGLPATADDIERAVRLVWRGIGLWMVIFVGIGAGEFLLA